MRLSRFSLAAAALVAVACSSEGSTALEEPSPLRDARLSAAAVAPTATVSDAFVSMSVAITNALPESVSGGVCAQMVEARAVAGSAWTDVTSANGVCQALAMVVLPGGTASVTAMADQAKIRAVAGTGATSVVLRVKSQLAGSSTYYLVQSNEVTWTLP